MTLKLFCTSTKSKQKQFCAFVKTFKNIKTSEKTFDTDFNLPPSAYLKSFLWMNIRPKCDFILISNSMEWLWRKKKVLPRIVTIYALKEGLWFSVICMTSAYLVGSCGHVLIPISKASLILQKKTNLIMSLRRLKNWLFQESSMKRHVRKLKFCRTYIELN